MRRGSRLRLARLLLAGLVVVVMATVAGVVLQGWRSAERARLLRHQLVAERLFDSMERELTAFLGDEEGRPFVEYRPVDGFIGARPEYVVGWFQIDPAGELSTPHPVDARDLDRVRAASADLDGWGGEAPVARTSRVTVRVPVEVPTVAAAPRPPPKPAKNPQKEPEVVQIKTAFNADNVDPSQLPIESNLNNAALPRSQRVEQTQAVSRQQLEVFSNPPIQQAVQAPAEPDPRPPTEPVAEPEPEPEPPAPASRKIWVPVQVDVPEPALAEVVDVIVSPLALGPGPEPDTLVLHRTVRLDTRTWVQGLLVDVPALQSHLVSASLAGSGLDDAVDVRWGAPGPIDDDRYAFEHAFAAPFEAFGATAVVTPLPDATGGLDTALWVSSALLLVLAALGLIAVYRMLVLSVRHAQQRDDFVSAVTHELKSPLTSIRMYSEMLEQGVVADEGRRQDYYATIRGEAERLTRLVDDVLVFSRLERGLPVAEGSTGRLAEVVDDAERLIRPQADALGRQLVVRVAEDVADVEVDRDALSQVLTNLLDNAVKFSAESEDPRILVEVVRDGDRAVVRVRDHGPGVPGPLLRRMFEPFVRGERELTRRTRGTGIGLALVRRLVDGLGGSVEARNHPEGGLEVAVVVPIG